MLQSIYKKNRYKFLISLIPVIIVGIMAPMRSYIMQLLIDSSNYKELLEKCLIAAVFSVGVFIFEWICKKSQAIVVRDIEKDLRNHLMQKLFYISANQFEKKGLAYYLSKFTTDIGIILNDGVNNVYGMIMQFVFAVVAVIYLLCVEPFVLLIVAAVSFVQFAVPNILKKKIASSRKEYTEALEVYLDGIKSDLGGHKVIRTFGAVEQILGKQKKLSDFVCRKNEDSSKTLYWAQALASFVNNAAFLVVLGSCMFFVAAGRITVGEIVAITNMMNFVLTPCKTIAGGMIQLRAMEKVKAELEALLEQDSENDNKENIEQNIKKISLDNVGQKISDNFSLDKLTMTFEKGKKYAIVGKSGSGKSSIIKLLTEYGPDYTGRVLIDGHELSGLNKESIMHVSPVCYQQTYIFSDTVFNNVTLYQDYSKDEVIEALRKAGIYDTIQKLPGGVDEKIQENGKNFSGGELQRIALARLFLRNKTMTFLDEITSGLDNATAYEIEKRLLDEDMTIISITHRYNKALMQKYDEIIVMCAGKVVERGKFDELMGKEGEFFNLYKILSE
ncbi:MAG: ABC transporter ATP-binding protein [Lachnospiraceae bacterium]|jgi:ABC-type multidrug transport system fused ATPase/permease subunit|nr:ABC transporter ATP-binding protein [Lachnospiraceae bacterium]